MYLDLTELDEVFAGRWFWSTHRCALARFRRRDYLGDPRQPLDTAVRELVESRGHPMPTGPIRLLTQPRQFGFLMNPVSFYYCFDATGRVPQTIVAEVTNTPWGERHWYVLPAEPESPSLVEKEFHVSPFLPMEMQYRFQWTTPGRTLAARMQNWQGGQPVFDAVLYLQRRPISAGNLAAALLRFPAMSARVMAGIYWQAVRLWWKGATFHSHPGGLRHPHSTSSAPRVSSST